MKKLLTLGAAIAGLCVVAVSAPANAADRKSDGIQNDPTVTIDLSARHRHWRRYGGYRYYGGPYYGYPYAYGYYPYGYYPYRYYRRPGIYFGFY